MYNRQGEFVRSMKMLTNEYPTVLGQKAAYMQLRTYPGFHPAHGSPANYTKHVISGDIPLEALPDILPKDKSY